MKTKLDKIIVVDVEATCWEGRPPMGEMSEIIEIGVCPLDIQTREICEAESILVKPVNSRVSEYCKNLTTLTQEKLYSEGIFFEEACRILKQKYDTQRRVCASYGQYDKNIFTKQCEREKVAYPFNQRHLNVKTLFALKNKLLGEVGMTDALKVLNIPPIGTHHRGADDAKNIAIILSKLLG